MEKTTQTPMTATASSSLGMLCCRIGTTFALPMTKVIEQVESVHSVFRYGTTHIVVRRGRQGYVE